VPAIGYISRHVRGPGQTRCIGANPSGDAMCIRQV
jgi:hypothetical protein